MPQYSISADVDTVLHLGGRAHYPVTATPSFNQAYTADIRSIIDIHTLLRSKKASSMRCIIHIIETENIANGIDILLAKRN